MVAVQVVEVAAALDRDENAAEHVIADWRRCTVGHLLFVVGEEDVGGDAAADLLDARAVDVVPALLEQVAVVVLHLRQPVLRVSDEGLLAGETLVAHGHVAVGVVVETVGAADRVDRVEGAAVAVRLAV